MSFNASEEKEWVAQYKKIWKQVSHSYLKKWGQNQ